MERQERLLIIGLDGATFDLARPWMDQGKLPNLERLRREGVAGELCSTIPFNSAVAWSAFMTGKNPGNNNIFDFFYRPRDSYQIRFVNARTRRGATFWSAVGQAGLKVGVMNVPVTFPPEPVNGFLISGMMSPEVSEVICHPRELYRELRDYFDEYRIKVFGKEYVRRQRYDELLHAILANDRMHFRMTQHLMRNKPWDLFCSIFTGTDHGSHYFWHVMDPNHPLHDAEVARALGNPLLTVYTQLDAFLGELIGDAGPDTSVIVLSDHGHGPNRDAAIHLNYWLRDNGYLRFGAEREGFDLVRSARRIARQGIGLARKYVPRIYKNKLRGVPWVRSRVESFYRLPDIDWRRTLAFSDEVRENVWINVRGRFPSGQVAPGEEYHRLREELIERLRAFRDEETGELIFREVLRREEVYVGRYAELAPDIVMKQGADYTYVARSSNATRSDRPIVRFTRHELGRQRAVVASHRQNGLIFLRGNALRENVWIEGAHIVDVAPTVFYLLGLPIPRDLDGHVLTAAIREERLAVDPPRFCDPPRGSAGAGDEFAYSQADEERIADQLKGLGYIE